MKRAELIFNMISLPLDGVMLFLAGLVSFYIRVNASFVGPIIYKLDLSDFLVLAAKIIPILLVFFVFAGLYNLRGNRKITKDFMKIFMAVSVGLFFVIVLFFFNQSIFPSRFIILSSWGLSIVFVFVGRLILRVIQVLMFANGYGLHKLVLINGNGTESKFIQRILLDSRYGYKIVKKVSYGEGTISELDELFSEEKFDEIIQINPSLPESANLRLLDFAKNKGLLFSFVPNLFEVQRNVVEIQDFKGIPVINIKNTPLDGWGKVVKRMVDLTVSAMAMIILSPVYLLIFFAVKIDSKGPAIYPALRGGCGKDFWFYKFRSMQAHLSPGLGGEEAEKFRQQLWEKNDRGGKDAPFLKVKNDPRVTRVGRIIRKTKLDEIPQFWNVFKGDMSLVGPRAHVLDEVDRYRNKYQRMFSIKPGIFGVSQIAQISWPDLPFDEEIRLNTYYIENWSLWLDMKVLIQSFYYLFLAKKPKENY